MESRVNSLPWQARRRLPDRTFEVNFSLPTKPRKRRITLTSPSIQRASQLPNGRQLRVYFNHLPLSRLAMVLLGTLCPKTAMGFFSNIATRALRLTRFTFILEHPLQHADLRFHPKPAAQSWPSFWTTWETIVQPPKRFLRCLIR